MFLPNNSIHTLASENSESLNDDRRPPPPRHPIEAAPLTVLTSTKTVNAPTMVRRRSSFSDIAHGLDLGRITDASPISKQNRSTDDLHRLNATATRKQRKQTDTMHAVLNAKISELEKRVADTRAAFVIVQEHIIVLDELPSGILQEWTAIMQVG